MQYISSKQFIKKLDELYLVIVSLPILAFFVYYIWFLVQVKEYEIIPKSYSSMVIGGVVILFLSILIVIHVIKYRSLINMRKNKDLNLKLNLTYGIIKKVLLVELVLFLVALGIFYFAESQWMSIPVWVMFGALSFEKPSVYRIARHVKFPDKRSLDIFIHDEPLSSLKIDK